MKNIDIWIFGVFVFPKSIESKKNKKDRYNI